MLALSRRLSECIYIKDRLTGDTITVQYARSKSNGDIVLAIEASRDRFDILRDDAKNTVPLVAEAATCVETPA